MEGTKILQQQHRRNRKRAPPVAVTGKVEPLLSLPAFDGTVFPEGGIQGRVLGRLLGLNFLRKRNKSCFWPIFAPLCWELKQIHYVVRNRFELFWPQQASTNSGIQDLARIVNSFERKL